MRVLHVGKFFAPFAGGIENFMLDLMCCLDARGTVQAALVHESPGAAQPDSGRCVFPFEVARVPAPLQVAYAPISPGFTRALEAMLVRFGPDVLHLHLPNPSAFWALKSRRARSLPWVVQWQSDVVGPGLDRKLALLYPFYRPFEQALLGRADAVIASSPPYLESSPALRPWRGKCRMIALGLDDARIAETGHDDASAAWSGHGALRVLAITRLSRYKGIDVLIEAAGRVDGVEVLVAGDGDRGQRRRLEAAASRAPTGRIRLLGRLGNADRNRLLHSCDVACLPSIHRAEAFGIVLLEAMAAGKPAIATRVPGSGMGWVVEHGRTGWLVEPGDVDALAGTLAGLVDDRGSLGAIGRAARSAFEARFRIDRVAAEIEAVYRDVDCQSRRVRASTSRATGCPGLLSRISSARPRARSGRPSSSSARAR